MVTKGGLRHAGEDVQFIPPLTDFRRSTCSSYASVSNQSGNRPVELAAIQTAVGLPGLGLTFTAESVSVSNSYVFLNRTLSCQPNDRGRLVSLCALDGALPFFPLGASGPSDNYHIRVEFRQKFGRTFRPTTRCRWRGRE